MTCKKSRENERKLINLFLIIIRIYIKSVHVFPLYKAVSLQSLHNTFVLWAVLCDASENAQTYESK